MASIIRIKRSSGTDKPASLNWGEMAYVTGIGSYGGLNQYKDRVYVGDDGNNVHSIGGHFYTSMMEHAAGAVTGVQNTRNTDGGIVAIMDSDRKVDQWNVDNIRIDLNTISSQNVDGDIIFDTNGDGHINIVDDTTLSFGSDKDAKIEYDEDGDNDVKVTGAQWTYDTNIKVTGKSKFGCVGISSNVIETEAGCGDLLFIDPYPDGLSNEGTVVIKGSLQVDGTTTTVNSTNATLNDPVMHIGDVTSKRTVTATIASGVSTATLDSVVGINTGDILTATSINASGVATVSSYNTSSKVVTFSGTTSAGIATETQITVTHAFDTNTDRGISFSYNTGTGTANNKTGFFGYIDEGSSNTLSNAPDRSWTYIPEASVAGNNATGVRGFLDVKGLYFQSSDYASGGNGIMYFDTTGKSVVSAGTTAGITTSNFVLTTNAAGIPKWTNTLDGGTF